MKSMRLFAAIEPPDKILKSLQNLQVEARRMWPAHTVGDERKATPDSFLTPHSPWKLTDSDSLRFTLQFLGDRITHHKCDEIVTALSKIEQSPFSIECTGAGAFPNPSGAKILWAGVKSPQLEELAKKVAGGIAGVGILQDKKFSPHITIARCKFPSNVSDFVNSHSRDEWSKEPWNLDSFCLFESVHTLGGHEYSVVKNYRLV